MLLSDEVLDDLNRDTLILMYKHATKESDTYQDMFNTLAHRITIVLVNNPEIIEKVFPGLYKLPRINAIKIIRTYLATSLPLSVEIYEKGVTYANQNV